MINVKLLKANGEQSQGGAELIDQWRSDSSAIIWIDLEQNPDSAEISLLQEFHCHKLAILDAHRERHPPKIEQFSDQTFILFRGITEMSDNLEVTHLQLALFVGERFLISRHNSPSYGISYWLDNEELFHYLKSPASLALKILHTTSGKYLEQLLDFESNLSDLEDTMQSGANDEVLKELIAYKTRLRKLRRGFDYHQKMVGELSTTPIKHSPTDDEHELLHQTQDLFERCERLHSLSSMYYEICGDLIEGYLSLSSHQLNITMKILTVITAVFVPLSFIAGLYGMNFEYMPELKYHNAYFITLGVMLTTAFTLLAIFWKKRWL
jgi:magnesium transporter